MAKRRRDRGTRGEEASRRACTCERRGPVSERKREKKRKRQTSWLGVRLAFVSGRARGVMKKRG